MALESEPGAGTRFTIQLPLTLAIADALIGRVGAEAFAVPQSAVREVIEVAAARRPPDRGERNHSVSRRARCRSSGCRGCSASTPTPPARFHVFVIGTGAAAVGLAVDRIVGQREIVVRAIADPLVRVDGISGATDLGDGRVVLILDPAAIARLTARSGPRRVERRRAGDACAREGPHD